LPYTNPPSAAWWGKGFLHVEKTSLLGSPWHPLAICVAVAPQKDKYFLVEDIYQKKHSESIASNTKSPTGGIFNQNSSSRTKLNFDF
jgi:hypothetical protein